MSLPSFSVKAYDAFHKMLNASLLCKCTQNSVRIVFKLIEEVRQIIDQFLKVQISLLSEGRGPAYPGKVLSPEIRFKRSWIKLSFHAMNASFFFHIPFGGDFLFVGKRFPSFCVPFSVWSVFHKLTCDLQAPADSKVVPVKWQNEENLKLKSLTPQLCN